MLTITSFLGVISKRQNHTEKCQSFCHTRFVFYFFRCHTLIVIGVRSVTADTIAKRLHAVSEQEVIRQGLTSLEFVL